MNQIVICPHCSRHLRVSEQITDKTLICPQCFAEVGNPQPGSRIRAPEINIDVKRDENVGCIVLAVLFGLCVLGIAMSSSFGPLIFLGVIGLLVIIAMFRSLLRGSAFSAQASAFEKALGILFLVLGTCVAVIIFGLFACAALWRPHWGL